MENLDGRLVIGVSSRALFDLEAENEIFEKYGVAKYRKYQLNPGDTIITSGTLQLRTGLSVTLDEVK